jgi:hypothetical protein
LHIVIEMEMPKVVSELLQTVGKGVERKATRHHERFEVGDSLKSIEEIGVGGDIRRIRVQINRDA